MSLGITEEQRALAGSIAGWAAAEDLPALVRASADETAFADCWKRLAALGVPAIAVPEELGGAGGSVLDLACALESCALAMVPGPLLATTVAAVLLAEHADRQEVAGVLAGVVDGGARIGLAVEPAALDIDDGAVSGEVPLVAGDVSVTHLLVGASAGQWHLLDAGAPGVRLRPGERVDLSRGVSSVELDAVPSLALPLDASRVRALALSLAAAEAAGVARWSLECAVGYAKVREQFGRPIGSFQAVKHLCAEMLETCESATAVAWDAATAYDETPDQHALSAAIAGSVALDAAVSNAQACIQVLGGIGFTWEHDAHLYLRRAMSTRLLLGGADPCRLALADAALAGQRRATHVDLGGRGEDVREEVRADLRRIAGLPETERRAALADAGLVAPHWPEPYGRGAGPAEQIVIDEELAAAGVERPELAIGAWALPTILEHGNDAQRARFVAPTLRGELIWCQLFSEPGAGSDLASLRTRAVRVEGGWRLTGQKVWTSLATEADWAICLARTDPEAPQHRGITYFLVDMSAEGIDVRPLRELTGEAVFNEVFLDQVLVPDGCVVGEVDGGWRLARTTLANERVAMVGRSLGTSVERALRLASAGGPVAESLRLRLGAAVADAATVKALALRSTLRSIAGSGPGAESSVQKLVGVRQRQESAELVLDVLGAQALVSGPDAEAAWREALLTRCLSIAGGTTQVLRNVAGERILGLPRG